MNYILKNGLVVDPIRSKEEIENVVIENGKICSTPTESGYREIDCSGKLVVPGLIDVHTHLRDPGQHHKEDIITGGTAGLAGGFTTIFCMPNTSPVIDSVDLVTYIIHKSRHEGAITVYPVAAMTKESKGKEIVDFEMLKQAGAVSFSDDGVWVHDSAVMLDVFRYSAKNGVRVIQHCEDKSIAGNGVVNKGRSSAKYGWPGIPAESEEVAVYRDVALCGVTGAHLHVAHISTAESLKIIKQARERGIDVTCEVAPHHLLLSEEDIPGDDASYKVNPPLRTSADCQALIEGLADGSIDIIATDHAPHASYEKEKGFIKAPCGMIGLEFVFALLYTHLVKKQKISLSTLISAMSTNPARYFGLDGKGSLSNGADADVTVINLNNEYTIDREFFKSKSTNTPFHGWTVNGTVESVFVAGQLVYANGKILNTQESSSL
ncbi:MAG: dihydroorotase [Candidatus Auribacter fodinae]|jgi:dihydroorotase|uniref:Dihydroorotase n=1 Tax=Candidatus Auribacter fodinae TaxID=2093366 RepID=A0A3A4QWM7_9BACT|nr:MAG: dihydroorotase [Candidatus Auribacter fodinae]